MNRKQIKLLLVLVLVIGGLGLLFYQRRSESWRSSSAGINQKVFPQFPLNDIARIIIRQGKEKLHLEKKENRWRVNESFNYPANFSQLSEFLRKFWELKATQRIKIGTSQL